MICKNCNKEFTPTRQNRSFCSYSCRTEYRDRYLKAYAKQYRAKNRLQNSFKCLSKPVNSIGKEFIFDDCCNAEMKKKTGYCITLYEPYFLFKGNCSQCRIYQAFKIKGSINGNKAYRRRTQ
ncbi:hypothetical protein [Thermodesulfovibrio sp. 3462-1]|uniref:DUF2116 family Zn-ribbon domain-containing protein n=1 Tax=Thermodesulfovibrio obliviosus TaxID=3118332 RepID=A0AAU8H4Q6_9BACT